MAVRDGLENFLAEPLPEFHNTFLMTRWTEMPSLTRKCQKILMPAVVTPDTCKAIMEYAAIKVAMDNLSHIGPKISILLGKTVIVNLSMVPTSPFHGPDLQQEHPQVVDTVQQFGFSLGQKIPGIRGRIESAVLLGPLTLLAQGLGENVRQRSNILAHAATLLPGPAGSFEPLTRVRLNEGNFFSRPASKRGDRKDSQTLRIVEGVGTERSTRSGQFGPRPGLRFHGPYAGADIR